MGRRHVVKDLSNEQFTFVIETIIDGMTDREISAEFETKFGQPLAKSSLNRWRTAAGEELADRYRLARYQASQLLSDLKEDGSADKFQIVMRGIEDKLLTATREVIAQDPVKLLRLRLDEEKRRLKEREIDLKREQLELDRERFQGAKIDPAALPGEILTHLTAYVGNDPAGLSWLKKNMQSLEAFLTETYAQTA